MRAARIVSLLKLKRSFLMTVMMRYIDANKWIERMRQVWMNVDFAWTIRYLSRILMCLNQSPLIHWNEQRERERERDTHRNKPKYIKSVYKVAHFNKLSIVTLDRSLDLNTHTHTHRNHLLDNCAQNTTKSKCFNWIRGVDCITYCTRVCVCVAYTYWIHKRNNIDIYV